MASSPSVRLAGSRPRVLALGAARDPLRLSDHSLIEALHAYVELRRIGEGSLRSAPRTLQAALHAIRHDAFEAVHLMDPRLAPIGRLVRRLTGVPVSASLTSVDVCSRLPLSLIATRSAASLDEGFSPEHAVITELRERAPRLRLTPLPPSAQVLPWPTKRSLDRVKRTLAGVRAGRLVVAVPWPESRADLCWFRDVVAPQMEGRPIYLLIGVPSRRAARLVVGQIGRAQSYRVLPGPLTADVIAAVARFVDAFALASPSRDGRDDAPGQFALALAMGGVPVVTNGMLSAPVFAHERNAFVADPGDERGYVQMLNQVLAMPAMQRHVLGEEFARFTLARWRPDDVAATYADRFAALVGRPQIPLEFRAA